MYLTTTTRIYYDSDCKRTVSEALSGLCRIFQRILEIQSYQCFWIQVHVWNIYWNMSRPYLRVFLFFHFKTWRASQRTSRTMLWHLFFICLYQIIYLFSALWQAKVKATINKITCGKYNTSIEKRKEP